MKTIISFLIGSMLFLTFTTFGQIGLDTYTVTRTTGITYTSISGSGTAVTSWKNGADADDNMSTAITIPFSFPYDGGLNTTLFISLNGFVTFNTATNADGADLPACGTPEPYAWDNTNFSMTGKLGSSKSIAVYYNDLVCNNALNSSIYYTTTGSAPNRVFTVQWTNMYNDISCTDNSCTETPGSLNFQLVLYETSGNIEFLYGPTMTQTTWSCSGYTCSVDDTYSSGLNSNSITSSPTINQLITQQTANTNSFSNAPQNNLTALPAVNSKITFTRTAPPAPGSTPGVISINYPLNASTNQCLNTILSWNEGTQNPTSFEVYFGTAASPPLVATISNTYYNPGPLNMNTTYYWKIIPINGLGAGTSSPVYSFATGYGDIQPTEILLSGIGNLESHVADGTDALGRTIYYNTYSICRDEVGLGTLTPQSYYLAEGSSLNWTNPIIVCGVLPALTCENAIPNADLFTSSCDITSQTPAITITALLAAIIGNALCPGIDPYIEYDVFTRGCNQNVGCTKVRFHILPDPDPGVVQNTGQTICSGGDPSAFGFSTLPDENFGSFTYQWYSYNGSTSAPTGSSVPGGWTAIPGASGSNAVYYEPFLNAPTVPAGWTFTSIGANSSCYGSNAPAVEFDATNDRVLTQTYSGPVTNISFNYGATSLAFGTSSLKFEAWNGSGWTQINNYTGLNGNILGCNVNQGSFNFSPALNYIQFRWTSTKPVFPAGPNIILDDVNVTVGVLPTYDPPAGLSTTTTYACYITPATVPPYSGQCAYNLWAAQQWVVTVSPGPAAPSVTTPVNYCQNAAASQLTASGSNLLWYTVATGGTGSSTAPTPSTSTVGTTSYWVSQTTTCEGPRGQIDVVVSANATPIFNSYGPYCVGASPASLPASSNNGITGTWSPATIGTGSAGTTTYTFTPTAGLCAITATLDVTVTANATPSFSQLGPYCIGTSPDLLPATSVNGITGTWNPATISTSTGGTSTYTFTPDGSSCAVSATMDITVNSAVANAGNDQTICSGDNVTLTATGGTSYTWSNGVLQSIPFVPSGTGTVTYTVTVTDANSCTATDQVDVIINTLPPADAGTDQMICPGGQVTLTATGGTSYNWDNGVQQGVPFTPASIGTTTYTVTVTDANSCSAIDYVHVTMDNVVANAGSDQIVCYGEPVTLTATGGNTYQWDNGVTQGLPFVPTASNTYSVTVTVASSCTAIDQVVVTVNSLPPASAGNDTIICYGTSANLTATGGVSYLWTTTETTQNISVSPNSTTMYGVIVTGSNGCTASDSLVVTVNNPVANAGNDQSFCEGSSVGLSATGGGTYLWSPSAGLSDPGIYNPTANPTVSTVYVLTVTDGAGCTDVDSILITVNPLPVVLISADTTICQGNSVNLSAQGGVGYLWTPSGSLNNNTISNPVATPSATTTYSVVVTDINGCVASDQVAVTVNNLPVADAGNNAGFCEGGSTQLNASGGSAYLWNPSAGLSSNVISNPLANPTSTTTYTVTVTDLNGCQDSDSVTVTVNSIPAPQITGNLTACQGQTFNYSTTNQSGHTYSWSITGGSPVTATSYVVGITWGNFQTGILYVTEMDATSLCSGNDSAVVVIHETPVASVTASGSTTVCEGTAVALSASGSTGTPPLTYTWDHSLPSGATQTVIPSVTAIYHVTVSNADNCGSVDSIAVNVNALPVILFDSTNAVCSTDNNGSITSTIVSAVQPVAFLWSNGATVTNLSGLGIGQYTATVTDGNGCDMIRTINISSSNSENCLEIPSVFSPNNDGKNDKFEIKHIDYFPGAKMEIYNRWDNLLFKSDNYDNPSNWWDGKWKGKDMPMGSYLFILTLPGRDPIQGIISIIR